MEPQYNQTVVIEKSPVRYSLVVILLALLLALGAFGWWMLTSTGLAPVVPTTQETDSFSELHGNIYFTASKRGSYASDLYRFNVTSQAIESIPGGLDSSKVRVSSEVDRAGKRIATFQIPVSTEELQNAGSLDFFTELTNRWEFTVRDLETGVERRIGSRGTFGWPRLPRWSPDGGSIAFTVAAQPNIQSNDSWIIDVVTVPPVSGFYQARFENIIGNSPFWSPDGTSIIYARDDGLYVKSLLTESSEKRVIDAPRGTTTRHAKFAISKDGTLLAWSMPENPRGSLFLYEIESWAPFQMKMRSRLEDTVVGDSYYWPFFSPDGRFIAVQRISGHRDAPNAYHEIVVYDVETGKKKSLLNLGQYNPDMLFLTDWTN